MRTDEYLRSLLSDRGFAYEDFRRWILGTGYHADKRDFQNGSLPDEVSRDLVSEFARNISGSVSVTASLSAQPVQRPGWVPDQRPAPHVHRAWCNARTCETKRKEQAEIGNRWS